MRKYRKCVLTLGLLATAPGVTLAGPFDFLRSTPPAPNTPPARPDNQQIAEQIADVLRQARLNGSDIEINVQGGVARIAGNVQDASQKAKATWLVSQVSGVERLDNQLTFAEPAPEPLPAQPFAQPPMPLPANHPFAQSPMPLAANDPFAQPPMPLSADHPFAQPPMPLPANDAAPFPSVPAIQPADASPPLPAQPSTGGPSNQKTAERIAQALRKERLNGYDIQIRFRNGTALLAGSVKDAAQRARAEKAVAAVPGVEHVDNQLLVAGKPAGASPSPGPMPVHHPGQPPMHPVNYQPMPPMHGGLGPLGPVSPAGGAVPPGMPMPGGPVPDATAYGHPGIGTAHPIYNMPYMPESAWPSTAQYPNSAAVQYPTQYSASAWPYIGPFYPYPQVPLGWREAQLEWDDGHWYLNFRPRTDRWWWFLHPKNW